MKNEYSLLKNKTKIFKKVNHYWWALILLGLLVIFGWIFNIPILTSISASWVTMKLMTAICFVLTGLSGIIKNNYHSSVLSMIVIIIVSFCLGTDSVNIFQDTEVMSSNHGVPSIMTIVSFLIVNSYLTYRTYKLPQHIQPVIALLIISIVCIIGYITFIPILIYYIPDVSSAMALHTAIGFLISAMAINKDNQTQKNEDRNKF